MTDTSPGPDWWLASDGKWYPPHLHPEARAAAARAVHAAVPTPPDAVTTTGAARGDTLLESFGVPTGDAALAPAGTLLEPTTRGSIDWDQVARARAEQRAAQAQQDARRRRRLALAAVAVLALAGIVLTGLALRGDGDDTAAPATTLGTSGPEPSVSGAAPVTTAPATATTAAPTTGGTISVFSLQPGSCIDQDNLTTGLVTSVRTVPCIVSHTHEVYHRATVTPVNTPFDAQRVTDFANKVCTDSFTAYVGVPYEQSKYYFVHLAPSEESWNKNNDRDVVCLLLLEGQRLTSSVKGKGE